MRHIHSLHVYKPALSATVWALYDHDYCYSNPEMESIGRINDTSSLELPAFGLSLELVKFDPTANALEHDNGAEAPEFRSSSDAPQVCAQLTQRIAS